MSAGRSRDEDGRFLDDLAARVPVPDLAPAIMDQLGYARVDAASAQRRRRRARVSRALLALCAVGLVAGGLVIHDRSSMARRPGAASVPSAVGHDLERHRDHFTRTIGLFRELAVPAPTAAEALEPTVPADPAATIRPQVDPEGNPPVQSGGETPDEHYDDPAPLDPADDGPPDHGGLDRSAHGPWRWL